MNGDDPELTDADREELLRLVLCEAEGKDMAEAFASYPHSAISTFRRAAFQAGLVQAKSVAMKGDLAVFEGRPKLSDRGRKRLKELNERKEGKSAL